MVNNQKMKEKILAILSKKFQRGKQFLGLEEVRFQNHWLTLTWYLQLKMLEMMEKGHHMIILEEASLQWKVSYATQEIQKFKGIHSKILFFMGVSIITITSKILRIQTIYHHSSKMKSTRHWSKAISNSQQWWKR